MRLQDSCTLLRHFSFIHQSAANELNHFREATAAWSWYQAAERFAVLRYFYGSLILKVWAGSRYLRCGVSAGGWKLRKALVQTLVKNKHWYMPVTNSTVRAGHILMTSGKYPSNIFWYKFRILLINFDCVKSVKVLYSLINLCIVQQSLWI